MSLGILQGGARANLLFVNEVAFFHAIMEGYKMNFWVHIIYLNSLLIEVVNLVLHGLVLSFPETEQTEQ